MVICMHISRLCLISLIDTEYQYPPHSSPSYLTASTHHCVPKTLPIRAKSSHLQTRWFSYIDVLDSHCSISLLYQKPLYHLFKPVLIIYINFFPPATPTPSHTSGYRPPISPQHPASTINLIQTLGPWRQVTPLPTRRLHSYIEYPNTYFPQSIYHLSNPTITARKSLTFLIPLDQKQRKKKRRRKLTPRLKV